MENKDPSSMSVKELRNFSVNHKLTVVGTGKDGNPIKKDLLLAVRNYQDEERRKRGESEKSLMNLFDCISGRLANYKFECEVYRRDRMRKIYRLANYILSEDHENPEEVLYILEEIEDVLRGCENINLGLGARDDNLGEIVIKLRNIVPKIKEKYEVILIKSTGCDLEVL